MKTIEEIIKESPDNFVIQNALCRCFEIIEQHNKNRRVSIRWCR